MTTYGRTNYQLPYTYLVTKLRMSKRQSETEMAEILKQIINLKNSSELKSKQEVVDILKKSREKIEQLKQRLRLEKQQQDEIYNTCRKRVHLDQDLPPQPKELTKQQILDQFDKEVLQFFACRNKIRQARMVQKQINNNYYFDLYVKLYQNAFNISESISKNDLRPLKEWCYQHSHFLSKMRSSLEFKLICCGFINILNNKNSVKAIEFLRKEIATLTLSEQDKQELNKMTFAVLLAQNQQDYQYYSDSEKQKELLQELANKLPKITLESLKPEEKIEEQKPVNLNQVVHIQVSSSSSVEEALNDAQQKMNSLFRAFGQLIQMAQGVFSSVMNTQPNNPPAMQPQQLETPEPDPQLQEDVEEIYEAKFDSLSEQLEDQKNDIPKSLMQDSMIRIKHKESQDGQKPKQPSLKQIVKQIKRKNILDKNNLRSLLNNTKKQFLSAFQKIYRLSFNSYFDKTLAIGMAVMKTSSCSESHSQQIGKQRQCPICTSQVQKIIKNIPGTLKNQSSLICRINGSLMNQINHPITLPNGQIYSLTGLQKTQKNGKYFCMADKKWFRKQVCKKVFLT